MPTFTIGREINCDVPIADESVSRVHAEIWLSPDGALMLADRGSSNGTTVIRNGLAFPLKEDTVLPSDEVRIGRVTLKVSELVAAVESRHPGALTPSARPVPAPPRPPTAVPPPPPVAARPPAPQPPAAQPPARATASRTAARPAPRSGPFSGGGPCSNSAASAAAASTSAAAPARAAATAHGSSGIGPVHLRKMENRRPGVPLLYALRTAEEITTMDKIRGEESHAR